MANSKKDDSDELSEYQLSIVFSALTAVVSLLVQLFIVNANVVDWLKGRPMTGADKIVTLMGMSRIFLNTAILMTLLSMLCFPNIPVIVYTLNDLTKKSSAFADGLLSTLLSVFFYVKVSTSHNVFFLRLKAFISRRVVYLIIACVLLSVGFSSMFDIWPPLHFTNSTQHYIPYFRPEETVSYVHILCTVFSLLIYVIASLLLIILLGLHTSRMKNRGNATSSSDTYHRALTFTAVSFLISAIYIAAYFYQKYLRAVYFVYYSISNIYAISHSVLLIYVTTKLRNQFFRIVHHGTDCLFNRHVPGRSSCETTEVTAL